MTQLTIRGFSVELKEKIKTVAAEHSWSQNKAAIFLLKQGAGLTDGPISTGIGSELDAFIGSWDEWESEEAFETIEWRLGSGPHFGRRGRAPDYGQAF